MQNIKEIHCSISEKYGKTLFDQKIDNRVSKKMSKKQFVTLNTQLIPGLFFLNQVLHSVGLYHNAKNQTNLW